MQTVSSSAPVAPLDAAEIRWLVQLGFESALNGQAAQAWALFSALERLRPAASFVPLGRALALLAAGRHDEAVGLLEPACARWPEEAALALMLAMALQQAGRPAQARALLLPLRATADAVTARAVQDLLC